MMPKRKVDRIRRGSGLAAAAALAVVALVAAAGGALPLAASAANSPPKPTDPNQPFADGCTREPAALIEGSSPSWTFVYQTPSTQTAPTPQWVTGTLTTPVAGTLAVHPSRDD